MSTPRRLSDDELISLIRQMCKKNIYPTYRTVRAMGYSVGDKRIANVRQHLVSRGLSLPSPLDEKGRHYHPDDSRRPVPDPVVRPKFVGVQESIHDYKKAWSQLRYGWKSAVSFGEDRG